MSKSGKLTDENKIGINASAENSKNSQYNVSPSNNRSEKNLENSSSSKYKTKPSLKHMQSTQSDGNIIKSTENVGLKQKLVNKVKSWNNKEGKVLQNNESNSSTKDMVELASEFEGLTLSPDESDDNLFKSDWLRARDSLENLLSPRPDKTDIMNSKSTPFPSQEKSVLSESPCSESQLGKTKTLNSVTKVLAWDPWDKLGRKNKKDNKRRKYEKSSLDNNNQPHSSKDHTAGDEIRNNETAEITSLENEELLQTYEYQPYHPKSIKAVEFTNEVMVVYITGDEVVGESTEPLKKELEQQIRNKEMRRGHSPATVLGKRRIEEDYMSAWLKK